MNDHHKQLISSLKSQYQTWVLFIWYKKNIPGSRAMFSPKTTHREKEEMLYLLVEKIQSNPIMAFPDNIVTEGRGIPAIASLFVVRLFAQGLLPQAVSRRRFWAAVYCIIRVGSAVYAVIISIRIIRLWFALPVGCAIDS